MSLVKPYLSLTNILLPNLHVSKPPSLEDHLPSDFDFELRVRGCDLIQFAGVLLKLPQVSIATAQLLYQRFFFIKSFVKYNFEVVAMAATFLASKIDESPRRPRDVINAFHHIRQIENKEKIQPLLLDQYYVNVKNQVIKSERRILKELGFAVHAQHPHKLLIIYLQTLECERNQRLVQIAWNYLNDSYKTNVFMCYQPPSIACACIFLAARHLQLPLPNNPPWYSIFNVTLEEIRDICSNIFKLYTKPKLSLKMIDKTLTVARKLYEINKSSYKDSPNESGIVSSPSKNIKDTGEQTVVQNSFSGERNTNVKDPTENGKNSGQIVPDLDIPKSNATSKKELRKANSTEREKESRSAERKKRHRRQHHKSKHRSTPSPSPKYVQKREENSKYSEDLNDQHKKRRNLTAKENLVEPESDNLLLARQRQSLLYSIQEQKKKNITVPKVEKENTHHIAVVTVSTKRSKIVLDGHNDTSQPNNHVDDTNPLHTLTSAKHSLQKPVTDVKRNTDDNHNHLVSTDVTSEQNRQDKIRKKMNHLHKDIHGEKEKPPQSKRLPAKVKEEANEPSPININFNPRRHTNMYPAERKKIIISLKSSPKMNSPKHKHSLYADDSIHRKKHKKR